MVRKIIAVTLITFSSILLGLSLAGIGSIWMYKAPLTQTAVSRLRTVDYELKQAQTTLQNAKVELERTLRIVEAAEQSMAKLKTEFAAAKALFGNINGTLDNQLIPGMKASREKINQAKTALQDLRVTLGNINTLPFMNLNIPGDQVLADLITGASSLDAEIVRVEELIKKASTFASDASYLMGSDFSDTKNSIQNFLAVVQEYDKKLFTWRTQLARLIDSLPGWIESTSIGLTIFLLWFGLSQVSLIERGLTLWRSRNPAALAETEIVDDDIQI